MIINSTIVVSKLRLLLLNPALRGNQGSKLYLKALDRLNRSLELLPKLGPFQFGLELGNVEENLANAAGDDFRIGTKKCSKFTLVDELPSMAPCLSVSFWAML